jgi:hypothetical protein
MAKHPAAFINAIADEGTKAEAIEWLQKTWDELCDLRKRRDQMIDRDDVTINVECDACHVMARRLGVALGRIDLAIRLIHDDASPALIGDALTGVLTEVELPSH